MPIAPGKDGYSRMESDILFAVSTPLGFRVRVTRGYWEFMYREASGYARAGN